MGAFGGWFVDVLVRYLVDCLLLYTRVFSGVGSLYLWKGILGGGNFWMCLYTSCCFTHTEVAHRHTPPSCKLVIACPNIMLAPTS